MIAVLLMVVEAVVEVDLQALEAESIYILREAYRKFKRLAMLWSIGKDSCVMLWLLRKAFFGHVPIPCVHVDTSYKIPEMITFRDRLAKEWGIQLIVGQNRAVLERGETFPNGRITRVEVLGGRFLYAIRVYSPGDTFNLCPADVCQTTDGAELARAACPVDAPRNGLRVEGFAPPPQVVADVERIAAACGIEVGGIEYVIDARDGQLYYYDVNALSNFVADAPRVVGFDPFARLADFLEQQAR